MLFYLGTCRPYWLWGGQAPYPLFVSRRTLCKYKNFKRALNPWALDSGGFSELNMYGRWQTTPEQYAQEVRRFAQEIGKMQWAAIQDWMCEPKVREKTGLSVQSHQELTVLSYLTLRNLAPEIQWAPVIQGWIEQDYHQHVEMYASAGVDLSNLPIVGVGSVCRRQHSDEIGRIVWGLVARGISLHGFGVKTRGLAKYASLLTSSDSMAWSVRARHRPPLEGCTTHKRCNNCPRFAAQWRAKLLNNNPEVS